MHWFFRIAKNIPVKRGGVDTSATKQAIRYAKEGGLVGNFPEGRINITHSLLLPGRPGAALIALRARVPVIPCYISGSPRAATVLGTLFTPAKARLVVGRPIDLSSFYDRAEEREAHEEVTKLLLVEIAKLAGREDYQPRLAGRHWMKDVS